MIEITEHHPKCERQKEFRNPQDCPCADWTRQFPISVPKEIEEAADSMIGITRNDGTAGHSKKEWLVEHIRHEGISDCIRIQANDDQKQFWPNYNLVNLAQSAPHDCGDPECPGYQNKRKLELYDKFQRAIHEFAQAGLLT